MPTATQQPIVDLLNKVTGGDPTTTQAILDLANKIDFAWFEWAFKVGLVALAFIFFKDIIYNIFYYLRIRYDKFVGIGALVRLDETTVGRIKSYDLSYMVIETAEGFIRIPLSVWCSNKWTQLKTASHALVDLRKERQAMELKLIQLQDQLTNLQTQHQSPSIIYHDTTSLITPTQNTLSHFDTTSQPPISILPTNLL